MSEAYDAAKNSKNGYDLAIRAAREQCIRSRQIKPSPDSPEEQRWAAEGPRAYAELEAVRK